MNEDHTYYHACVQQQMYITYLRTLLPTYGRASQPVKPARPYKKENLNKCKRFIPSICMHASNANAILYGPGQQTSNFFLRARKQQAIIEIEWIG